MKKKRTDRQKNASATAFVLMFLGLIQMITAVAIRFYSEGTEEEK